MARLSPATWTGLSQAMFPSGKSSPDDEKRCPNCSGTGKVWMDTAYARVPILDCYCVEEQPKQEKTSHDRSDSLS